MAVTSDFINHYLQHGVQQHLFSCISYSFDGDFNATGHLGNALQSLRKVGTVHRAQPLHGLLLHMATASCSTRLLLLPQHNVSSLRGARTVVLPSQTRYRNINSGFMDVVHRLEFYVTSYLECCIHNRQNHFDCTSHTNFARYQFGRTGKHTVARCLWARTRQLLQA
jgi:hypothetical protein